MAIALLEDLTEKKEAFFEDDETQGNDQGHITWLVPTQLPSEKWLITISGVDVAGDTIAATTTEHPVQEDLPTPAQVFIWVAQKLKSTLCPTCV